jgi:anti-sigma B factor antagonist
VIPRHAGLTPWAGGWLVISKSAPYATPSEGEDSRAKWTLEVTHMPPDPQPSGPSLTHVANEQASSTLSLDSSGRAVLTLRGEQDILTILAARRELLEGVRLGAGHVIIDLSEVSSADEALMGLIALALRLTRHAGGSVCLVAEAQPLLKKLRTTGLDRMAPLYAALSEIPEAAP